MKLRSLFLFIFIVVIQYAQMGILSSGSINGSLDEEIHDDSKVKISNVFLYSQVQQVQHIIIESSGYYTFYTVKAQPKPYLVVDGQPPNFGCII